MKVIITLKRVRELKGFSQNELARATNFSTQHIQKMEQGRAKSITLDALERLCIALNCKPGDLLEMVESPKTPPPTQSVKQSRSTSTRTRKSKKPREVDPDNIVRVNFPRYSLKRRQRI